MPQIGSDLDALAGARFRGVVQLEDGANIDTTTPPPPGSVQIYPSNGRLHTLDEAGQEQAHALAAELPNPYPLTRFWSIFGHSYMAWTLMADATQRTDAMLREAMGLDFSGWRNFAVTGASLTLEKRHQGGWTRVYQESANLPGLTSGPYTGREGGAVFCWGINDIAHVGQSEQVRQAFKMSLTAAISRWRAATIFENDYGIGSRVAYSGYTQNNAFGDVGSGNSVHMTTTVGSTITLTLPSDYKGEPVVMSFLGKGSSDGATVSFSGTAGVTGTLSTSDVMPLFAFSRCPVIKRVTNLTAANAGQTIVITVDSFGGGTGDFMFDCWWLESLSPPPVVVCDIARATAAGYALYAGWSGTEAEKDATVTSFNSAVAEAVNGFDAMVQIAHIDAALNKDASLFIEGLHPNDAGGAKIVDAILDALQRLAPPVNRSPAASFAPAAPRTSGVVRPRLPGQWFGPDGRGIGTQYTAMAGDMFAMPFYVSQPRSRFITIAVEALTAVTGTAVRWGVYDDVKGIGYPQVLVTEPTASAAFTITTGTGSKQSPSSGTGSFNWAPDPGLYWLVVKFTAAGTTHNFRTVAGPSTFLPNLGSGGVGSIQPSGWKLTGQGNTALPTVFPAGAALSDNCPILALYHL